MKKTFHETARAWLDGSAQTPVAQLFRVAASLVATPYSGVVRLRNRLYDAGLLRASQAPRPTISVGNLTLGGVGKTPFVGWLADYFTQTSQSPAFISRGYQAKRQRELFARVDAVPTPRSPQTAEPLKSQTPENAQTVSSPRSNLARFSQFQHFNDEARELALLFPETPHFLGSNRLEVASALVEARPDVDVLLLDDAFQ
ncbi:MAG: tetraacyldisaccharide 4'-kinase, partial [Thermoguttaceae bacterium]|nr:tetraacyldisaccharide 4'-kinase [Thermoguttaceae bacterium]